MSQELKIKIDGLKTNNNSQNLPDGSLIDCANIVLDRNIAESRRGFKKHSAIEGIQSITEYQNHIITHAKTISSSELKVYDSTWSTLGNIEAPSIQKVKFLQANQNLYFTTSEGIQMLDQYNGQIYGTGLPRALDGIGTNAGSSGFQKNDTQVAYRILYGTRDVNNNLYLGSPSQRIIVANSTGSYSDVSLTFTIPQGITTDDFFQVYRSRQSSDATTPPDDELQLIYEANPSSGEISAKSVTFTDNTPDDLVGAFLYTNANQEGPQEANDQPPLSFDLTEFKGFTFFSNIRTKHYLDFSLLAVDGANGLSLNDTITIDGMVFTAKSATNISSREFKLFTSGSVSQNIEDTSRELIRVINQYASNTKVYAYYESSYNDLPGQILLEERLLTDTSFLVTTNKATAWKLDNNGNSQNYKFPNGLMWSKLQQPEHVPFAHLLECGSKNFEIKRIISLKDALFILKEDGVFRLTGVNGQWSVETLDSSTSIIAPDSAVVINNQIYCLSSQGVVSISDVGVQVIGEDIKDQIQKLIGEDFAAVKNLSFGVGYETDRKYLLNVVGAGGEIIPSQTFVYNVFTGKWSRWKKVFNAGGVIHSKDLLFFANEHSLLEERKSFTYLDFVDEEFGSFSILNFNERDITLSNLDGINIGDLLIQGDVYSTILEMDYITSTVLVRETKEWTVGPAQACYAIDTYLEFAPTYSENAGLGKFFQEVVCLFKQNLFTQASVDFYTDLSGSWDQVEIRGNSSGQLWGSQQWGVGPWAGLSRPKPTRVSVPRNKTRGQFLGIRFSCRMAHSQFQIEGLSLIFEFTSERIGTRT